MKSQGSQKKGRKFQSAATIQSTLTRKELAHNNGKEILKKILRRRMPGSFRRGKKGGQTLCDPERVKA